MPMNAEELRTRKRRDSHIAFLDEWPWEWFCTLNLPQKSNHSDAEKLIKHWRIKLATREKIQVAYQGVFSLVPHEHVHLVMLGRNRRGETLYDKYFTNS